MKILEMLSAQLAELYAKRSAAVAELDAIAELATTESRSALTTDEETAFAAAETIVRGIDDEIDPLEVRIGELTKIAERTALAATGAASRRPIVPGVSNAPTVEETRGMTPLQLADTATRALEARGADLEAARPLFLRHKSDTEWTRGMIARSTEAYTSGFMKMVTGRSHQLTSEERAAIAVGTTTQGGYLVPTHLDPSIILTNAGSTNVLRQISRVVTLTREKTWNGVSTAGSTASWDGEYTAVSDDSPTFAQPSIPTYKAQGFVQASFEAIDDIEGLAGEVLMILGDAKDRLEASAFATGAGSTAPKGIFTACDANTNVEFTSATAATLALADLTALKRSVPVRFRGNGTWVMNPVYADAIRALGTAVSASFSGDITGANTASLLGRPVVELEEAPSTQTTTVRDNEIIYGDFRNFIIVDKPGSTAVDYIPNLFDATTGLPDGRRGWFMTWRTGSDVSNITSFALLQDKTSA